SQVTVLSGFKGLTSSPFNVDKAVNGAKPRHLTTISPVETQQNITQAKTLNLTEIIKDKL
ncbi:unnamed protein product, partial [marine sediment metagenome]